MKREVVNIGGTIVEDRGEVVDAFSSAMGNNDLSATTAKSRVLKGWSKREVTRHFGIGPSRPSVVPLAPRRIEVASLDGNDARRTHKSAETAGHLQDA